MKLKMMKLSTLREPERIITSGHVRKWHIYPKANMEQKGNL